MKIGKWLLCLIIMIQIGKNTYIQPGEVVAVVQYKGESAHVVLKGGAKVYSDWPIPRILGELFDRETLKRQMNPLTLSFKAENEKKLLRQIHKYNKNTIFEPEHEEEIED